MNTQVLSSTLEKTLQHDKAIRKHAEETLKQMKTQPQFPQMLLHLIATEGAPEPVKTAAAIYFKNLTKNHWDPRDESHVPDSDKNEVRNVIVKCLIQSKANLRTILSDAIGCICKFDFPASWPNVVGELVSLLNTQDFNTIVGALYTAHTIFKKYRTVQLKVEIKDEMLGVIQLFGPPLLELFERTAQLLPNTSQNKQQLTVVFETLNLVTNIFIDLNSLDIADFFLSNLARFMNILYVLLTFNSPLLVDPNEEEQPGLQEQSKELVVRCIALMLEGYDDDFNPFAERLTNAVWDLLLNLSQLPKNDNLCIAGLDFLCGISKNAYTHNLLSSNERLKIICERIIIPNIELRESDAEMFVDDPREYIQRDIEGSDLDTRRRSACELIRGLSKHYEQAITEIFQSYVGFLLQEYKKNSNNWKCKDTAMYLITALTQRGASTQKGIKNINDLVEIGPFVQNHVIPELRIQNTASVQYPILKADAIKYISSFRLQMPKNEFLSLLQILTPWLNNESVVVHSYAATAIERLLMVLNEDSAKNVQYRIQKQELKDFAGPLLQHLFQALQASKQENEYIMRAIMRVILRSQEHVSGFVQAILPILTSILTKVAANPKHPVFNHYLFESISGLIRYCPTQLSNIHQSLFNIFTQILQSDTPEFMPYVFQILSQLIDGGVEMSPYMPLFAPLLNPALYENRGNIPALVRLICSFLEKASAQIVAAGQIKTLLGVFQHLVSLKLYDHEGFHLLNTIVDHIPAETLSSTMKTVFEILFARLMRSRTTKYVKCFILFLSLFTFKVGPDPLVELVESLQPNQNLWNQVYLNVWLRDVQKVSGQCQRKLCVIALSRIMSESKYVLGIGFNEQWATTTVAALKLLELGVEEDAEGDKFQTENEITVEQLKKQEEVGYTNAYCPLTATSKKNKDLCPNVPDERAYFAQHLQQVMSGPCANQCAAVLRSLPVDIQQRLKPVLPSVF